MMNDSFGTFSVPTGEPTMETCSLMPSSLRYLDYLRVVYIINCVLNSVFSLVAISGNFIVLLALWRTPKLHEPSHLLLGILAMTDFTVGVIVQPLYVVYKVAELYELPQVSCIIGVTTNILANLISGMSFMTVTLITVDLYLALHLHLRYKAVVTKCLYIKASIAFIVLLAIFSSFYPWLPAVAAGLGMVMVPICLIVSTIAYGKIYKIYRRHIGSISDQSQTEARSRQNGDGAINFHKHWKSVVSIAIVQGIFLLCFTPYFCALIARSILGVTKEFKLAFNITTTIIYINSSLNPFVFCWRLREIRKAVFKTIGEFWKRRSRSNSGLSFSNGRRFR